MMILLLNSSKSLPQLSFTWLMISVSCIFYFAPSLRIPLTVNIDIAVIAILAVTHAPLKATLVVIISKPPDQLLLIYLHDIYIEPGPVKIPATK